MKLTRLFALLLALLMAFSCLASAEEAAKEPVEEAAEENVLLATVNGDVEIYQSDVDEYINEITNYYSQYGIDPSDENIAASIRQMAMETCLQIAFYDDLAIELGFDPLSDEDANTLAENISTIYEGLIQQVYSYYGLEPAADATEEEKASARNTAISMLDTMGYTYDFIGVNERRNLIYGKVNDYLTSSVTVSDEEVQAEYDAHVQHDTEQFQDNPSLYEVYQSYYGETPYYIPEGFRGITQILLKVDNELLTTYQDLQSRFEEQAEPVEGGADETAEAAEDATEEAAEEATEEDAAEATAEATEEATEEAAAEATEAPAEPVTAEEVEAARLAVIASVQDTIDEIRAKFEAGTPWLELVDEYNTDPGMQQEPYRTNGYSVFADSMMYDSAFVQAAFSLDEIGTISEPYVGMYGIYIVHYTRDVPAGPVELTEELRAELRDDLLENSKNAAVTQALENWIANTDIVYTEAGESYRVNVNAAPEDIAPTEE